MVVTVVLRLLPGPLEAGELVGHAEVIATGVQVPIRRTADLVAAARDALGLPLAGPGDADASIGSAASVNHRTGSTHPG